MAHLAATSRVAWVCLALLWSVVAGGGADENDHNLLNFEVSLPDGSGRVDFICDVGSGGLGTQKVVFADSSELVDLMEQVVVSNHNTRGSGEFSCWHEKLGTSVPSKIVDVLGSQIQAFLSHRLRSLLANEAESSLAPIAQKDGGDKIPKDNSSTHDLTNKDVGEQPEVDSKDPDLAKGKEAKNATDNAPRNVPSKENKPPVVEDKIDASPPPLKEENKENQDTEKETPADPVKGTPAVDQSGQHHDTHDSKYNVCEEGKNLVTLLQTSGDGTQALTLSLRNDGEGVLDVQITTPIGLMADPSRVHLRKGEPSLKVNISIADEALLAKNQNPSILISSSEGDCMVPINLDVLGNADSQSYFDRFSMPNMPTVVTPGMRLGAFFFIMSIFGGLIIWRTWARWRPRDATGAGHSYQELEMSLPSSVDNATSAYGLEKDDKSAGSGNEEGWDEVWDDWEDTEAARSSSRLIPSLSAKGLAARRSNKDGWDNSWDD
ncbi:hypothetical protein Mapa_010855 [Marchantia paleacea]|nr:hypothetical protein Mapa_010855 [Marchantia paleacea]